MKGYHIHKDRWSPVQYEVFACQHEAGNAHNPDICSLGGEIWEYSWTFAKKYYLNVLFILRSGGVILLVR